MPVTCVQVSACGELARLGLVAGTPAPSAATSLYDWDLATAALAASHAVKLQLDATLAQSRQSAQPPPPPKGERSTEGAAFHCLVTHMSIAGIGGRIWLPCPSEAKAYNLVRPTLRMTCVTCKVSCNIACLGS